MKTMIVNDKAYVRVPKNAFEGELKNGKPEVFSREPESDERGANFCEFQIPLRYNGNDTTAHVKIDPDSIMPAYTMSNGKRFKSEDDVTVSLGRMCSGNGRNALDLSFVVDDDPKNKDGLSIDMTVDPVSAAFAENSITAKAFLKGVDTYQKTEYHRIADITRVRDPIADIYEVTKYYEQDGWLLKRTDKVHQTDSSNGYPEPVAYSDMVSDVTAAVRKFRESSSRVLVGFHDENFQEHIYKTLQPNKSARELPDVPQNGGSEANVEFDV